MSKVVLGLLVGGILGIFDGLSAWFTPGGAGATAGHRDRVHGKGFDCRHSHRILRKESELAAAGTFFGLGHRIVAGICGRGDAESRGQALLF